MKAVTQELVKKKKADVDAVELVKAIEKHNEYEKGRDELVHTTNTLLKPRIRKRRKLEYPTPTNVKPTHSFLKLKYSTYDSRLSKVIISCELFEGSHTSVAIAQFLKF